MSFTYLQIFHAVASARICGCSTVSMLDSDLVILARCRDRLFRTQQRVKKYAKVILNRWFSKLLGFKAFLGRVRIEGGEMEVVVQTQAGKGVDESNEFTPVSRLSGGEKSFSTLCLCLALKRANDSPFIALDEIDVFMDERSRRIALQILIDVFLAEANSQAIIISPHSLSSVKDGGKIKKILIRPVDRSQRRLPFEPAG